MSWAVSHHRLSAGVAQLIVRRSAGILTQVWAGGSLRDFAVWRPERRSGSPDEGDVCMLLHSVIAACGESGTEHLLIRLR